MKKNEKNFYEQFEKLEENYQELYDYIKTMDYALQDVVDNAHEVDCLIVLAKLISEKSSNFFEQLEDFSIQIYKNYL